MTMASACVSTPVSWLRLEMYQLGELGPQETTEVRSHLQECPVCRSCAVETAAPLDLEPLRPQAPVVSITSARRSRRLRWVSGVSTAVVAAAAAWLLIPKAAVEEFVPSHKARFKGGDVVISLVRERGGAFMDDPERFDLNDRFKVLFTCPPGLPEPQEVVVFQDGEVSLPLSTKQDGVCGNRVPWEGAFQLTDREPATVCVVWGDAATNVRQHTSGRTPSDFAEQCVCRSLDPVE